jgi:hypothetical protein
VSNTTSTIILVHGLSRFVLLFLPFLSPLAEGQEFLRPDTAVIEPLEIRLAKPPLWRDHCLEITVKRVNHSKRRIFFPPTAFEGVEIYSSVTQAKNALELGGPETWILVYGRTDAVGGEQRMLAPGSEDQKTYCVNETFPVRDTVTNERRQVRLQGRLRISADYEQKILHGKSGDERQTNKESGTRTKELDSDGWRSRTSTIEIQIPCRGNAVNPGCSSPPPIFSGERDWFEIFPTAPVL